MRSLFTGGAQGYRFWGLDASLRSEEHQPNSGMHQGVTRHAIHGKGAIMTRLDVHLDADLAVTLEDDRPGTLAKAIACVSQAGINIDGYAEIGGVVHVLSPDRRAAHVCLEQAGFKIVQEHQVVVVPVHDEPGAAARVFARLAAAHINIKYSYLATRNRLVIAASDAEKALAQLSGDI